MQMSIMDEIYNPKEVYILQKIAEKLAKGDLILNTPDIFHKKIYGKVLDNNYEVTIRELA